MTAMRPTRRCSGALLLLALLPLAGCGAGSSDRPTSSTRASGTGDRQTASVQMTDELRFAPERVAAAPGRLTLTIRNTGRIPHDLAFSDAALGKTELVHGGKTATLVVPLQRPGTYRFVCTIHPGMHGEIEVTG